MLSEKFLLQLYYAYVYSLISYGVIFWGVQNSLLVNIFKIQKRSVRTMKFMLPYDSCRGVFKKMNLLTVPSIFIYHCIVFKLEHNESFIKSQDVHQYNTRNKNNVMVPKHRSTLFESSPYYVTAKLFDKLPVILKNIKNVTFFKNLFKKVLIAKEYYSVDEFCKDTILDSFVLDFCKRNDLLKYSK
jgi:hypothetical protein